MNYLNDLRSKISSLKKEKTGSMFSGVCSGIAHNFQVDTNMVRLLFVGLSFINGLGLFIYLFLHFFLEEA